MAFGDRTNVEEGKAGSELMRSDFRDIPGLHYLWSVSMTLKLGIVPDRLSTNNLETICWRGKLASPLTIKQNKHLVVQRLTEVADFRG